MSKFPTTREELVAAGYEFERVTRCTGATCRRLIEFWRTPYGKRMPLDSPELTPHFATCPDVQEFRRKATAK